MPRRYTKAIRPVEPERKARISAIDRAGSVVARWRTVWGDWVDQWSGQAPSAPAPEPPGLLTRLKLADDIAIAITQAEADARRAAYLRALEFLEADRLALPKRCAMPRCPSATQIGAGIRDLMRKEGL